MLGNQKEIKIDYYSHPIDRMPLKESQKFKKKIAELWQQDFRLKLLHDPSRVTICVNVCKKCPTLKESLFNVHQLLHSC